MTLSLYHHPSPCRAPEIMVLHLNTLLAHAYTTGQSNRRLARCYICRANLPKAQGQQWAWKPGWVDPWPVYLCPACQLALVALDEIEPEMRLIRADLRAWCEAHITLGYAASAYSLLCDRLRLAGTDGPEVGAGILHRLQRLEAPTYRQVLNTADSVLAQICGGGFDAAWGA